MLLRLHLAGQNFLLVDSGLGRLPGLLDASLHPVPVIASGLEVVISELLLDVSPDLTVLKIRIELNNLDNLFFFWAELMKVEPNSIESTENYCSNVE